MPFFTKRNFFSLRRHNALVVIANAFLNMKVVRGGKDQLLIGDGTAVLELKRHSASADEDADPGSFNYRGRWYADDLDEVGFDEGDVVTEDLEPPNFLGDYYVYNLYICLDSYGDTPGDPQSPPSINNNFRLIAGIHPEIVIP